MTDINTQPSVAGIPWLNNRVDVAGNMAEGARAVSAMEAPQIAEMDAADRQMQTQAFVSATQARTLDQNTRTQLMRDMEPYQVQAADLRNQTQMAAVRDHVNILKGSAALADLAANGDYEDPDDLLNQAHGIVAENPAAAASPIFQQIVQRANVAKGAQDKMAQTQAVVAGRQATAITRYRGMLGVAGINSVARNQVADTMLEAREYASDKSAEAREFAYKTGTAEGLAAGQADLEDEQQSPEEKESVKSQLEAINKSDISLPEKISQTRAIENHYHLIRQQRAQARKTPSGTATAPDTNQTASPGLYPLVPQTVPSGGLEEGAPEQPIPASKPAASGYTVGKNYKSGSQILKYRGGDPKDESNWSPVR